jgi:hypothetical protein
MFNFRDRISAFLIALSRLAWVANPSPSPPRSQPRRVRRQINSALISKGFLFFFSKKNFFLKKEAKTFGTDPSRGRPQRA